jgi:hypothetical protein
VITTNLKLHAYQPHKFRESIASSCSSRTRARLCDRGARHKIYYCHDAATLGAGKHDIASAQDAARALAPLAGRFGSWLFALGMVGTGLLAIPAPAASSARAPLYGTVVAGTIVAIIMDLLNIRSVRYSGARRSMESSRSRSSWSSHVCERPTHHGRIDKQPSRPHLGLVHRSRYGCRGDRRVRVLRRS